MQVESSEDNELNLLPLEWVMKYKQVANRVVKIHAEPHEKLHPDGSIPKQFNAVYVAFFTSSNTDDERHIGDLGWVEFTEDGDEYDYMIHDMALLRSMRRKVKVHL